MRLGLQLILVFVFMHKSLGMRLGLQLILVFVLMHKSLGMRLGLLFKVWDNGFWGKLSLFSLCLAKEILSIISVFTMLFCHSHLMN